MPDFNENVHIEFGGSPKVSLRSRGNGTQHYSIRVTNDSDTQTTLPSGVRIGKKLIIRNEDQSRDELIIDEKGNIQVLGDIRLAGADCAEHFEIDALQTLEPGTVMVIGSEGALHRCDAAYDIRVAGVISGAGDLRPALILGTDPTHCGRLPLALSGKVQCKVDAQFFPVAAGDMLTTSPSPGYAMKANDPKRAFGAVIGKALRSLPEGQGLIPILIALQ